MKIVEQPLTMGEFKWHFKNFITDLPHTSTPYRECHMGYIKYKFVLAQFFQGGHAEKYRLILSIEANEIADISISEGKSKVADAAVFGVLGGLVGGRVNIIITTEDNDFLALECGIRTDNNRKKAAKYLREMKKYTKKESTKICPFCAEQIKAAAIKCKHCGSMLDGNGQP